MNKNIIARLHDMDAFADGWIDVRRSLQFALDTSADMPVFDEVIFDQYVGAIVSTLKTLGVTKFAISTNQTSMATTITLFLEAGATLEGVCKVSTNMETIDFAAGCARVITKDAFLLSL